MSSKLHPAHTEARNDTPEPERALTAASAAEIFRAAADAGLGRRMSSSCPSIWDTGQPMDGAGHVWAQVGWIDQGGATYGLDVPTIDATRLKPLYICLGRLHGGPLAEESP